MINFKRILPLLTFFILSSCTTGLSNSQIKQILNNEKAAIFYSSRIICAEDDAFHSSTHIIVEKDGREELVLPSAESINPGKYLLSGFSWVKYTGSAIETRTVYMKNPFDLEIKSGQVLYLGDLKLLRDSGGAIRVMLVDNFNKTYEEMSKKYPQLLGRLERRFMLKPIRVEE